MLSIVERAQELTKEFSKTTGFKDFAEFQKRAQKATEEANNETKKRITILTELERAELALKRAQSEQAVEVQKVRYQTTELNKENKEAAKTALGVVTAYQKFAKEVNEAKNKAKNLGAEMALLEGKLQRGEITQRTYNTQLNKLSKEYVEATVKAKGLDGQIKKIDSSVGDSQRNVGNYKSALGGLTSSFRNLLAAFGVVGAIDLFSDLIKGSYDTIKTLNAQNYALKQVFETEAQVAFQKEYLARVTDQYGLALVSTTEDYTKFSAAVRGTALEGEGARNIFESFSGASSKLGLNAEQNTGIFKALEQMISKGTIQAEELRGQLGDRMPGAFKLFADAMGVSTVELGKLLKDGKVLSSDVLPKVADELNRTYNLDNATKADTIAAAQNRLKNSWTTFLADVSGNKDIVNGLAEGMETLGVVVEFLLDTLIVKGADGSSVLSDTIDIIQALFGTVVSLAEGLGLVDEKTKNNLFSLTQFKNDLKAIQSVISVVTGYIKFLAETISNFFTTLSVDDGWDKFVKKMEDSASSFSKIYDKYNQVQEGLKKANANGEVFKDNGSEYAKAWIEAKKAKQAYFQLNGKYFDSRTGKNTGKSLDDYVDRGDQLVLKNKTKIDLGGDDDKDAKKRAAARKKAQKDAERAAEQARKLAFANAKSEIEAQKLALEFYLKNFDEELALVDEKEHVYQSYYATKLQLLEKEKNLELSVAKTKGEANKIIQKYNLDKLDIEKQAQEKLKKITVDGLKNEEGTYKLKNRSILKDAIDLTDELVKNEKDRIQQISDLVIEQINSEYGFSEEKLNLKLQSNQELSDAEVEYLTKIKEEREKAQSEGLEVDRKYADAQYAIKTAALENEKLAQGKWFETDYAARTEYANKRLEIELDSLKDLLENKEITQAEYDARELENKLLHTQAVQDIENEFWENKLAKLGESFGKEQEMQEVANSAFALFQLEKLNIDTMTTEEIQKLRERELEGIANFIGSVGQLFGKQTAVYKAFRIIQATIDAFGSAQKAYLNSLANPANALLPDGGIIKAKVAYGFALGIGLANVAVIAAQKTPKFKDGTLFAEKSGLAITDEEGPELHYDKNWNLKDKGSKFGARFKNISKGDKIIPADISRMINNQNLSNITVQNNTPPFDYDKLANKIGAKYEKALSSQIKNSFLNIDGEIVRIETKGNVRTVHRNKSDKPTGQRLS